ncbi:MAG: hypothetical protein R6W84_04175 [Promethearchaeia archaeon]
MPKIIKKKSGYIRKKNGKTEKVKPHKQHYHIKGRRYKNIDETKTKREPRNHILEELKTRTKTLSLKEKIVYLDENYYDAISMLYDCGYSKDDITDIRFLYLSPSSELCASEHSDTHHIPDGIYDYIESISPVTRIWDDERGYLMGNDGNHRINTCHYYGHKVPLILIYVNQ